MRLTRVHVPGPLHPGRPCTLGEPAANHIARVLRLRPGDPLGLFDGAGGEYLGRIETVRKGEVVVRLEQAHAGERDSPLQLTLVQGVSRGERMDWVVQKAVELGVTRIVPVVTERSIVRLDSAQARNKQRHWHGIAVGACEQSGRSRLAEIAEPLELPRFLAQPAPADLRVLPSPQASAGLSALPSAAEAVLVLIGPEGGLTAAEERAAMAQGFQPIRLGPRVLRTETAAVTALALLQQRFGDL